MNIKRLVFAAVMLMAFYAPSSMAQQGTSNAVVVSSCGTLLYPYVVGQIPSLTQDTTGKLCDTGGTITPTHG